MRKITLEASKAFWDKTSFKKLNTDVRICINYTNIKKVKMLLFGYLIAEAHIKNNIEEDLMIRDAGFKTQTTKERLNGLLEVGNIPYKIKQIKREWYLINNITKKKIPFDFIQEKFIPMKYWRNGKIAKYLKG